MARKTRPPAERPYGRLTRSECNGIERGAGQGRLVQGDRPLPRPGPVHGLQRGGAPQDRDVAQIDEGPAGAGGPGRVGPEADVVTPLLQRVQEEKGVRLQPQAFLSSNR